MKIHRYERLEDLLPQYKAAFQQAEKLSFDCSLAWFENLTGTTLSPHDKLMIFVADDEQGQIVLLPMCLRAARQFQPRTLRTLTNFYTSLYSPIASNNEAVRLLTYAIQCIIESRLDWDVIDFSPLSMEHDSYLSLYKALLSHRLPRFSYFCFDNWYLLVQGRSYDEYFNGLPSRLKNTVKRKSKQFHAVDGARLDLMSEPNGEELDMGIANYVKVYNSSWKVHEPYPHFMPGLIRLCCRQGWLRMGFAYFHDQPIAVQIWIVCHGRAAIYKLAHDEKFDSYSVGSVLTAHIMRHVLDVDKVQEVDYLIGCETYKRDWMSHKRERRGIVAYNPRTMFGLLGAVKQALGEFRRKFLALIH